MNGAMQILLFKVMELCWLNILVRRSRQSGVARATNPDFESHRLLLILLVSDLNHILLA